jgi:heterodisulfide reductase subunit D
MAAGKTKQDRLAWLTGDLKTSKKEGEVFYWTGCTMFFDALFPELGVNTLEGTRAAVRLLNRLGVTPVVSPEERCCGHDLLWNGDKENFERLAKHNVKLVADSGAETLVVSCAECLRTWKLDYEPYFKGKPPKIVHLTEYLAEHLGELKFKHQDEQTLTYQDPCRLGRHLGIYEAPRKVMAALPDATLVEMPRSGKRAVCCAGGTWSNCDRFAKHIQVERLLEARATGAEALVTACPKCQVHFRCAMKDPNLKDKIEIPLRDLASVVLDALAE